MRESSRFISGVRVRTWIFDSKLDYLENRELIPAHEHRRYDTIFNCREVSETAANMDTASLPESLGVAAETIAPAIVPSALGAPIQSSLGSAANTGELIQLTAAIVDLDTLPTGRDTPLPGPPAAAAAAAVGGAAITAPGNLSPGPANHTDPKLSSPPATMLSPLELTLGTAPELLDFIIAVPVLLCITRLRGYLKGAKTYHYFLPPPPDVDLSYIADGVLAEKPMLSVSNNISDGIYRSDWLFVDMETIWSESKMSLVAEYDGFMVDIGLAPGRWTWVKTEWNGEIIDMEISFFELAEKFLSAGFAEGTPLIVVPVLDDASPYALECNPYSDATAAVDGLKDQKGSENGSNGFGSDDKPNLAENHHVLDSTIKPLDVIPEESEPRSTDEGGDSGGIASVGNRRPDPPEDPLENPQHRAGHA